MSFPAWQLVEDNFEPNANLVHETLFALANGHVGLRGAHEEYFPELASLSSDGTFINGFFESSPITYPENSYGLARDHEFMLNVPNAKCINFAIGNEDFDICKGTLDSYRRTVDFKTGLLRRELKWTSPSGKQLEVTSTRVVSFKRSNVFAIEYEIKSLNFEGTLTLRSAIDGRVKNVEAGFDPRYGAATEGTTLELQKVEQKEDFSALLQRTVHSGFSVVTAIENELTAPNGRNVKSASACEKEKLEQTFTVDVKSGDTICLRKYGAYFTSRDHAEKDLLELSRKELKQARKDGFSALCDEQSEFLSDFWKYTDITIEGDDALNQGMHFNQFHLLQSVGRDGRTSIAAKGLTGEGYGGHYFWDAETFALPFYLYCKPEIAREMLEYRYSILPKARERAREMSVEKGALFAWRTIDGEECSAYFPAGTAQYHINADIAFATKQYYEATGDNEFMRKYGAEMVLDTARLWLSIGAYIPTRNNQFCINCVTGPDEYTALVDNNFYTNAMAQMHLNFAADIAEEMQANHKDDFARIGKTIGLDADEPAQWRRAAKAMYLPYDQKLGIHAQDDTFLTKKKWMPADIPADKKPLLLHYHYLVIYRYQICKQADALLAMFLLGDQFTLEDKKRDYDYYEPLTTHDSSLSPPVFSIMAAEIGYHDKAYDFFSQTVRCDLDDVHNNTSHGVHIASMAGAWMCIVYGFGGLRTYNGKLQLAPYLPKQWSRFSFRLHFQWKLLAVEVSKDGVKYDLLEGDELSFHHHDKLIKLTKSSATQSLPHGVPAHAGPTKRGH